jgi:NADPH:quinone reductase
MKAVGLYKYLPIEDPQSLFDLDIPQPNNSISGHDLLVAIKAISVNPVDTKVRRGLIPITPISITLDSERAAISISKQIF